MDEKGQARKRARATQVVPELPAWPIFDLGINTQQTHNHRNNR